MSSDASVALASRKAQEQNRRARIIDGVGVWAAYYRSNPHRFAKEYLHLNLKLFQMILLCMMNLCATVVFIAARGLGKTFLSAVFCVTRAVLYPGTKICVASGTRGQALNVLEKIMNELVPNSKELASELDMKRTKLGVNSNAMIAFRNGSFIKVVTANDNARGNRANLLLLDEFRLIKKDTIDTILRKFLAAPRHPGYLDLPEYKGRKDLLEQNMTMYLSSAYYKDHWSFVKAKDVCRLMLSERADFVCGFPYQLSLQEGLLLENEVVEQITESDFNEVKWCINISVHLKSIEPFAKRVCC